MIITEIKTHVLAAPLDQPFAFSQGWAHRRTAMLVEIRTEDGLVGWGESINHGLQPPQVAQAVVEHALKPLLIGRSAFDREVLWETMYNHTRPYGQKGAALFGIAAVDIALWDLAGKALGQPIHRLLGGAYRQEIRPYATGFYRREGGRYPEELIDEALRHQANGYRAMKLKTGFGIESDIRDMRAVREAVGDDVMLMMDANCAYSVPAARRILMELEETRVHLFEEPLSPENRHGYRELKGLSRTYIAAGENEYSKIGFRDLISDGALDVVQPDLGAAGGITECCKISALAQAWHVPLIPHVWGTGIGLAAAVQFIASLPPQPLSLTPDEPMLEYDQSAHPFRQALIGGEFALNKRGCVAVPDSPGLGIEVDTEVIERYRLDA
ncbi:MULTISPECIES: mandelate racemase/muconate lactonizing enzyme family protein [unclassified Modicisalibacter]|uniref:mandelate racemase/muconate lactonizing enzyme family protein n=1 Tax=unclassified Modicisalibacter TaxID=2679913 RepID=UPI001CCB0002|nr:MULTISPECIES: mandelate racemase/muconate lactonizing enzyme family protein [unclassified Modicisalibacter]MBZ9558620.1 mandelate racemase/muconate lactonizing enzyme family protein [Modicisalibacter sp. R2A 31.J]MBZ9575488.1 mandelate racemase/muconate lactonizing enzyme family protein [Modicisalibacter sp. MOD 31.J]